MEGKTQDPFLRGLQKLRHILTVSFTFIFLYCSY